MKLSIFKKLAISTLTLCVLAFNSSHANEPDFQLSEIQENILYVNINTDDIETLSDLLNGIGTKKAQAIIDYRESNGPFKSANELLNIKGIGPKLLEKNILAIRLNTQSES